MGTKTSEKKSRYLSLKNFDEIEEETQEKVMKELNSENESKQYLYWMKYAMDDNVHYRDLYGCGKYDGSEKTQKNLENENKDLENTEKNNEPEIKKKEDEETLIEEYDDEEDDEDSEFEEYEETLDSLMKKIAKFNFEKNDEFGAKKGDETLDSSTEELIKVTEIEEDEETLDSLMKKFTKFNFEKNDEFRAKKGDETLNSPEKYIKEFNDAVKTKKFASDPHCYIKKVLLAAIDLLSGDQSKKKLNDEAEKEPKFIKPSEIQKLLSTLQNLNETHLNCTSGNNLSYEREEALQTIYTNDFLEAYEKEAKDFLSKKEDTPLTKLSINSVQRRVARLIASTLRPDYSENSEGWAEENTYSEYYTNIRDIMDKYMKNDDYELEKENLEVSELLYNEVDENGKANEAKLNAQTCRFTYSLFAVLKNCANERDVDAKDIFLREYRNLYSTELPSNTDFSNQKFNGDLAALYTNLIENCKKIRCDKKLTKNEIETLLKKFVTVTGTSEIGKLFHLLCSKEEIKTTSDDYTRYFGKLKLSNKNQGKDKTGEEKQ